MLLHEAIGAQLTCVFVDHGLLRLNEGKYVSELFRNHYNIPLVHVDASDMFLKALEGVEDPEAEAKDHRQIVHRCVRGRSEENRK